MEYKNSSLLSAQKKPSLFDNTYLMMAIIFFISWALASVYEEAVQIRFLMERIKTHQSILTGTAGSPYRYRLLVVVGLGMITKALAGFMEYPKAFQLTYSGYMLCCLFALFSGMYLFFTRFFSRRLSFFGILYVAGTIPITFGEHFFQPWSFLEAVFFMLALQWIYDKRHVLLIPLIIIAALNRETAAMIPILFLCAHYSTGSDEYGVKRFEKGSLGWFAVYFIVWAGVTIGLRYLCGYTEHEFTFSDNFAFNKQHLLTSLKNNVVFWGIFGYFAVRGYWYAPVFFRRTALLIPIYCGLIFCYAYWPEVRVFVMLYPVFVPLALSYIAEKYEV
ncbi:MAG: hypothetical protein H7A34_03340 [bacterium]|nr:hypothetical protein [bacterium]